MIEIKLINDSNVKSQITDYILHKLPHWFGLEASIQDYIITVRDKRFYGVYDDNNVIGFLCIKINNQFTADVYVLGILEEYHRKGIGKELIKISEKYLKENDFKFYMVKTLGESNTDPYYGRTREFYQSVGFYPLEEFKEIWDENNPCLIMVKSI